MGCSKLQILLKEIRSCEHCDLPLGPRPVLSAASTSKILIIGQAPGTRVHSTGIPWNDPSGDRLRDWLQIEKDLFYDESRIAIVPMGFCYPGKGKSGDLPPRAECAELWHKKLLAELPSIKLTLLIGQYAQGYYLKGKKEKTLTETVKKWDSYGNFIPLPHPSPRNLMWLRRNSWFEKQALSSIRKRVKKHL